jgi:hypothetical protein
VRIVRAWISADLLTPADGFTISLGLRHCPEAEFLDSAVSSDISIRKNALDEFTLQLHPERRSHTFRRSL